ncbi:VanZ family protein [Micrococcaceae bacterium Sec5.8]
MTHRRGRKPWRWVLAAYLAALAVVGFWPTPVDAPAQGLLGQALAQLHAAGVPDWIDYNTLEASANVLLFVPAGFAAAAGFRSTWWQIAGCGALVSACVELGQLLFLQHRYPSLVDVATNTGGALLGFFLAERLLARRTGPDIS